MKKVLLTATVQSHIAQFHLPLIKLLKLNGYEVHVAARNNLAVKNGLKLDTPDKIFDVPFERSPFHKNNIKAYYHLKKILSENEYDIVHCNTPMGGVVTRIAAKETRKKGTKVFYTAHGFHFYKGAPVKNWLVYYPIEKWLAHYTDKLITITKEDYELASKHFKTNVSHIHGVGGNSQRYFPKTEHEVSKLKRDFGYGENQILLLCIGELNKNKNQSVLLRALSEIVKEIPNIKLLLAGNGPMEQKLRNLVNELHLTNVVDFLGYRTDLENFIPISDIVISASLREGMPLNIMEAMLCKRPIIASKNRGHNELVQQGVNGYLFSPDDVLGLSKLIIELIGNEKLRHKLGENGSQSVKPYSVDNVTDELSDVYRVKQDMDAIKIVRSM